MDITRLILIAGIIILTILLTLTPVDANAHTIPRGACWVNAQAQPDGERYAYLVRCRAYVRDHVAAHTRMRDTARCTARPESRMPWLVCYHIVASGWAHADRSYAQSAALHKLLQQESGGGDCRGRRWFAAVNCSSGACGLHQFLPCRGLAPREHSIAGYRYIKQRYGSPEAAWAFHKRNGWY